MKTGFQAAVLLTLCTTCEWCLAADTTAAKLPALDPVAWAGPATNFRALQGKTVVLLTYVTWSPVYNARSGELVAQIKAAAKDKPVVILAISTDTQPADALRYMAQRGFTGTNILHGYDPSIARRFAFKGESFNYALIGPEGAIVSQGEADSYYETDNGDVYAPAYELSLLETSDLGKFRFLTDNMSQQLKELIFPMELGAVPTPGDIKRVK